MTEKVDTISRFSPLEIPTLVRAHWNSEPKEPMNLIGEPSTVKSEGVFQEAKKIAEDRGKEFVDWNRVPKDKKEEAIGSPEDYFVFADLRALETDVGELRLQEMDNEKPFITFKYNILFEALKQDEAEGIIFFDEFNLAPNMIKQQFYKLINDRAIGDIPLSDGVLCISAGNESEHSRGVTEDPTPLVLRRANYFIRPLRQEEYTDYAARTGHHKHIVGYLGFQPNDVHKIDYDTQESLGQPCPRTWTKLSNVLNSNSELSVNEVEMIATGLVGQGVAKKFSSYVKQAKKVDLQEILDNPELITDYEEGAEEENDLSLVYAIISGTVEKFREDKSVIEPAFEMALHFEKPEFGAFLLRSLKQIDEKKFMKAGADDEILDEDVANKVVDRYAKFLFKD